MRRMDWPGFGRPPWGGCSSVTSSRDVLGIVMARDEWPLLGVAVTHALTHHVDCVVVLDHASQDGTHDGLTKLQQTFGDRLRVLRLDESPYLQEAALALVCEVAEFTTYDWVYAFDADEFGLAGSGHSLRSILSRVGPEVDAVRYEVQNWIAPSEAEECEVETLSNVRHRAVPHVFGVPGDQLTGAIENGALNFFEVGFTAKVIFRASSGNWAAAGAHTLWSTGAVTEVTLPAEEFHAAHVPLLTERRAVKRSAHGRALREAGFSPRHGWQNQMLHRLDEEGRLAEFWRSHSIPGSPEEGGDPLPAWATEDDRLQQALVPTLAVWSSDLESNGGAAPSPAGGTTADLVQMSAAVRAVHAAQQASDAARVERDTAKAERDRAWAERDKAKADRDTAKAGRDRARAERDQARAERDKTRGDLDKTAADRDRARAERDKVRAGRDKARSERDEARAGRDRARAERDRAQAELEAILASRSWRLTAGLRKLSGAWRRR